MEFNKNHKRIEKQPIPGSKKNSLINICTYETKKQQKIIRFL